jgi:DNA-directed RNA polymerase specialized sigma24 family protein
MSDPPPCAPNDQELVQRIHDGDEIAFRLALERVTPRTLGWLIRKYNGILDHAELEDVLQEGAIALWISPPTIGERFSLEAWFLGVVTHKAIDILRRRGDVFIQGLNTDIQVAGRARHELSEGDGPDLAALFEAIATLSPLQRTVIEADLACDGHADDDQLASELGKSKESIQTFRSKALRKLRTRMHAGGIPDGGGVEKDERK